METAPWCWVAGRRAGGPRRGSLASRGGGVSPPARVLESDLSLVNFSRDLSRDDSGDAPDRAPDLDVDLRAERVPVSGLDPVLPVRPGGGGGAGIPAARALFGRRGGGGSASGLGVTFSGIDDVHVGLDLAQTGFDVALGPPVGELDVVLPGELVHLPRSHARLGAPGGRRG